MHETKFKTGSSNVFADLGIPEAAEYLTKADLAREIIRLIKKRGLNQTQAAELLGTSQPKISSLVRGDLVGFSIDRLIRFIDALGAAVEFLIIDGVNESFIPVSPPPRFSISPVWINVVMVMNPVRNSNRALVATSLDQVYVSNIDAVGSSSEIADRKRFSRPNSIDELIVTTKSERIPQHGVA